MANLEQLLSALNDLPKDNKVGLIDRINHDLRNLLTILIGFSGQISIRNSPNSFTPWSKEILTSSKYFSECLNHLEEILPCPMLPLYLREIHKQTLIPSPKEFLEDKDQWRRVQRVTSAQEIFAQHTYHALCLGEKPEQFDFGHYLKLFSCVHGDAFQDKNIELIYGILPGELITTEPYAVTLGNLLGNALNHIAEDGKQILVYGIKRDDDLLISVENDGSNIIPKTDLEEIFEDGYSTNPIIKAEWGLSKGKGLNIVKKEVEFHGGKIWAESPINFNEQTKDGNLTKQEGAGFYFTVPKSQIIQNKDAYTLFRS
jgi:signal transduction histidine kinase